MGSARIHADEAAIHPLPTWALARVFLRSLLLQATWNRRGMQNLGFVYALWPALVHLRLFGSGYRSMVEGFLNEAACPR